MLRRPPRCLQSAPGGWPHASSGAGPRRSHCMKPAPFIRHVPKTLDEALRILAEVAPQDGRVLAGGQSLVPIMAFRLAKPAHLVDINEVAGPRPDRERRQGAEHRRAACATRAFHKPVVDNPLGALLTHRRAPHRALSDPHARHVLRQPRARRSGVGMVPASRRRSTRPWSRKSTRGERLIAAQGFLRRHHVDGAGRGRTAGRGAAAAARGRRQVRLQRIQPPRRRFRHERGAGHLPAARRQDRRRACRRRRRRGRRRAASPKPKPR